MNILPFSAWYPEFEKISSPDHFFGTVKEQYTQYHKEGYFKKQSTKALFVYRIDTTDNSYLGLLATMPTSEYTKGKILKHEQTLASKEEKTIRLLLDRQANVKPILLTYPTVNTITDLLQKYILYRHPSYTTYFETDQARHSIWTIENTSLIEQLQGLFNNSVPNTFIADGHHRTSTMNRLNLQNQKATPEGDFSKLLVALFGSDQLKISAFNRIVKALSYISPSQFFEAVQKYCTIEFVESLDPPTQKHTFFVLAGDYRAVLRWKEEVLLEYQDTPAILDVQLLNDKILKNILGIQDIRTDKRIKYIPSMEGFEGLKSAMLQNPNTIGFYLYPILIEDLMKVVRQHHILPPKSTYFEPRMKNGLVVRRFF